MTVAKNGVEGLTILQITKVDGILLDIQMPVMDGLTMLEHVRKQDLSMPVIVMSAEVNKDKLILAMERGANDVLLKPIDVALLSKKCSLVFSSNIGQRELKFSE